MELYSKTYQTLDEKRSRVMIAKAAKLFSSGSKKLSYVHISPVTIEKCDGYSMQENYSGDRCIRLIFKTSYSKAQTKIMKQEIRALAVERLKESIGNPETLESQAFKEALEYLSNLPD